MAGIHQLYDLGVLRWIIGILLCALKIGIYVAMIRMPYGGAQATLLFWTYSTYLSLSPFMIKVITNLQHALHSLLLDVYQAIVGIIKQIKNAIGYYQEKDLQIQSLNGSFSLLCNVRMDGDQVVVLNISTFSDVDWSILLVTFKYFFGWASLPFDLLQELLSLLCIISRLYADFAHTLVVYWLLLGWGNSFFGWLSRLFWLGKSSFGPSSRTTLLLCIIGRLYTDLLMFLWFTGIARLGQLFLWMVIKYPRLLDLSTSSCVDLSTRLVTFKDYFFGWAILPLDLTQEHLSFLCIIGRLYTDFAHVLVVYWLLLGWGNSFFGWLSSTLDCWIYRLPLVLIHLPAW
ncbi:unnamed protein product [Absidia cylindrospora]